MAGDAQPGNSLVGLTSAGAPTNHVSLSGDRGHTLALAVSWAKPPAADQWSRRKWVRVFLAVGEFHPAAQVGEPLIVVGSQ